MDYRVPQLVEKYTIKDRCIEETTSQTKKNKERVG